MATLIPGVDYTATSVLTAANLATLVGAAAVTGIAPADFASASKCIIVSSGLPASPSEGDLVYETVSGTMWKYCQACWERVGEGFVGVNAESAHIPLGSVVKLQTGNRKVSRPANPSTKGDRIAVTGVALETLPSGYTGIVMTRGICLVRIAPSSFVAIGTLIALVSHATAGSAGALQVGDKEVYEHIGISLSTGACLVTGFLWR